MKDGFGDFILKVSITGLILWVVASGVTLNILAQAAIYACERNLPHYQHCSWHIVAREDKKS